jgi:hypothetical protein
MIHKNVKLITCHYSFWMKCALLSQFRANNKRLRASQVLEVHTSSWHAGRNSVVHVVASAMNALVISDYSAFLFVSTRTASVVQWSEFLATDPEIPGLIPGTTRLCLCQHGPPLCSSGQSYWLQIRRSRFDSRQYQIFWVVGLKRGPFSLESTTEELLGRKSSGFGLENREYGRRLPSRWPRGTLYPQKLALT